MTPREAIHAFVLQYAVPQIAARKAGAGLDCSSPVKPQTFQIPFHASTDSTARATYAPPSAAVCRDGTRSTHNLTGATHV
jgi:hypothetical protein